MKQTALERIASLLADGWTLEQLDMQAQIMLTGADRYDRRIECEAWLDAIDTLQGANT